MLRGDISNQQSFVIGFRYENSLAHYKDKTITDKLLNVFSGKESRAEIDQEVLSVMNHLYWNTEYTVVLVIDEENYTEKTKHLLESLPFNRVATVIKSVSEITMMLNTGDLTYFVTNDTVDRQRVNSQYAVDLDTFRTLFRKRVKRL